MKKVYLTILISGLSILCCNDDPETKVERISGLYEATTLTEPGQLDGGVDILARGGALTVELSSNYKVEGHFLIPPNIYSNYAPIDTNFFGEFSLDGDTLRFSNTHFILDYDINNDAFEFIISDARLETVDLEGHWGGFKIILDKQQ